ncbi:MAG: hypothetical protein EBR82_87100 [Caulobacteraceae bacterium]|nr:hypothetical protein [Caulobacteraceae bacterium]
MSDSTTPQDGKAMSPASAGSQPVAWAVMFTREAAEATAINGGSRIWRVTADREEAERLSMGAMDVVPLVCGERRFDAKRASVGQLLDRIKRFIDQTDPWTSQVVDKDYKINTPESRDARKALAELRKRLAGLT